ncbi:MAG TPA: branched-chain amino acid ABC transporter substrate-binding protein [Candidatus Acidoferrum sp.]|nr:branched-chain amino acid ABC transporter substrate-binding protein [Candidatus Acidoferrum sp.]
MIREEFLGLLAAAVPVFGAPAPIPQPTIPGVFNTTMRIGVVAPLSGDARPLGQQLLNGVQAAINELNDRRFATDPVLIFNQYDDHNDAANAVTQAQFAVGTPDMVAVIGHLAAAPTLAALDTYFRAQMPLIVPTVTDDQLTAKGYRNVFRLPIKNSDEGALLAAYVIGTGAKAAQVVCQDGDYGTQVAKGFVQRAGALHVNAPSTQFPLVNPDYGKAADTILAHTPDCIVFAGNVADLGPLLPVLRAKGYTGRFVASQGFFDPLTGQKYAKEAEGMFISTCVPYYPLAPNTAIDVQNFQRRYGALTPVTAFGYAGVQLVQAAFRRAQATNRLTMNRALDSGGVFDTMTGAYAFGPFGDVIAPNCYFYSLHNGKFSYEHQAHPSGFMVK